MIDRTISHALTTQSRIPGMSNLSVPELDFWEFVSCSRCHLPFETEAGTPPVPFWLTECGHVVCNNHLNADQTCAQCGVQGIQLVPLQKDLEAPMSEWFRSVPQALDSVAYATRFQIETLASLVRHYKNKCVQQRSLIDRLKNEFKAVKKALEDMKSENAQLRKHAGYQSMPSDIPNANGKRRMVYSHQHPSGVRTNSSPRSVFTPLGPDRLTLPPDRQQPNFAPLEQAHNQPVILRRERPGSSRFAQQYAYSASPPGVMHASMSHQQTAPRQAMARQTQVHLTSGHAHTSTQGPPFSHSSAERYHQSGPSSGDTRLFQRNDPRGAGTDRTQMPPPPTPQIPRTSLQQHASFRPPATPQLQPPGGSHRFVPSTPSRPRDPPASGRALLQKPHSQQGPQRFSGLGARPSATGQQGLALGPSRTASFAASGGQRAPFMPNR
ncbi:hypothetical protein DAEQUDRAFT_340492 [Daedalea quercina L-15889]|uniref:RING-type domain-containing protein n=1 Tax=Daedalea quercina L-15889 TaxID=1314783 RepID=A0A165PEX7_9APHY|nr:hypothetical protein DAEQUDRAFT_340492 [Daedalea quercina L-15889]